MNTISRGAFTGFTPECRWHQRKNLYLVCNRQPDNGLFTRQLVDDLRKGFGMLAPFYGYLWKVTKFSGMR